MSCEEKQVTRTIGDPDSGDRGTIYIADYTAWCKDPRMEDTQYHYDLVMLAVALQGRLNPSRPTLYIDDGNSMAYFDHMRRTPEDVLFGYKKYTISTIDEFLQIFAIEIRRYGLVTWDENVPATSNVAATVCGVQGYLPIRYSTDPNSLYATVIKLGTMVGVDLCNRFTGSGTVWQTDRASTGSAKCDAYIWAIEKLLPRCSSDYLGYITDAAFIPYKEGKINALRDYNIIATLLPDLDFLIAQQAFCFDLYVLDDEVPHDDVTQPVGTDRAVLEEILLHIYHRNKGKTFAQIVGYPNFFFKYNDVFYPEGYRSKMDNVSREFITGKICGSYNCVVDGDCGGYFSFFNCSLYSKHPLKDTYVNNIPKTFPVLDPSKKYISFYMGDYDGGAWFGHRAAAMFTDPHLADVPISWPINPNLCIRMAAVMDFAWTHAPECNNFIGGEGAGYVYPGWIVKGKNRDSISGLPDGTDDFVKFSKSFYEKFGITATAFAHNGDQELTPDLVEAMLPFSPDGIGSFYLGHCMVKGTPAIGTGRCVISEALPTEQCVDGVMEILGLCDHPNKFALCVANCTSPSKLYEVVEALKVVQPDIEVVDNYTLFDLMRQALG